MESKVEHGAHHDPLLSGILPLKGSKDTFRMPSLKKAIMTQYASTLIT